MMEEEQLRAIIESLLFAAGEPVSLARLGNAIEDVPRERIKEVLAKLAADFAGGARGVAVEEVAGGYQLRTPKEHALYIRRLLASKPPRLSRPLLETLAIIAYRPQVTRPEIEQLRGVDSGGVLETLLDRELIRIAGRKEVAGRPIVYQTTATFLELFGLKSLEALPELEEFRAIEGVLSELSEGNEASDLSAVEESNREPPTDATGQNGGAAEGPEEESMKPDEPSDPEAENP